MSRPGLTRERLLALFLLGMLLFLSPFLSIFNTPGRILGLPSLYLYLFAVMDAAHRAGCGGDRAIG